MVKAIKRGLIGMVMSGIVFMAACSKPSNPNEAQADFPKRPIHIVVPQAAGGSTDIVARTLQPFFTKAVGVPVVIDNVTGAGGKIGISQVYRAAPDGYQLLLGVFPAWLITQKTDQTADYDMLKMVPLYNVAGGDYNSVVVPYDSPMKSIADMVSVSAKKPLKVSGAGLGTNSFLTFCFLKDVVKANIEYIPYNSGTEAAMSVVGKHVDASVGSLIAFDPLVKQKQLRVLAVMGPKRSPLHPEIPTLEELGYKGAAFDIILGINAPPGTPPAIASKLEAALGKAANDSEFKTGAERANFIVEAMDAKTYQQAIADAGKVVDANLKSLVSGAAQAATK